MLSAARPNSAPHRPASRIMSTPLARAPSMTIPPLSMTRCEIVSCFRRSPGNRRVALMSEISALEPLRQVGLTGGWRLQHDLPLHQRVDAVGPPKPLFHQLPAPHPPPPLPPPPAHAPSPAPHPH